MQVLSVDEYYNVKYYTVEDGENRYIAEQLFINKKPRSQIMADIKRSISSIIEERKDLIKHSCYIKNQGLEQIEGEYCLIRRETEVYTPLSEYIKENEVPIERIVEWMTVIGEMAKEAEDKEIFWQGITMDSLWIDKDENLRLLDPDIVLQISKYRELNVIKPIEIYQAPEIFNNKSGDKQSAIYSVGIIMYYLLTGKKPFMSLNKTEINKSDLVHEIINNKLIEPIYLNSRISPALNQFVMSLLNKERESRIKDWSIFFRKLKDIKEKGIFTTKEEESSYRASADKVIRASLRKRKWSNFWRKRKKIVMGSAAMVLLLYIITITGGSDPYINQNTSPKEVVGYFYQAINGKNITLLEETTDIKLKRLSNMVTETHVIEKMRSAYNTEPAKEDEGIFGIKDLEILMITENPQAIFEVNYIFYFNTTEESEGVLQEEQAIEEVRMKHYEVSMTDRLELGNVEGLWKIVNIKGSIEYIINGKMMELLEE